LPPRARRSRTAARGRRRLAVDALDLLDEAAVAVGQADDRGLEAGRARGAHQALDQPGAERVEPLDPHQVDRDARRLGSPPRGGDHQGLELVRVLDRPGAGGRELEALARQRRVEHGLGGRGDMTRQNAQTFPLSWPAKAGHPVRRS
jgi:hypothetical protein